MDAFWKMPTKLVVERVGPSRPEKANSCPEQPLDIPWSRPWPLLIKVARSCELLAVSYCPGSEYKEANGTRN